MPKQSPFPQMRLVIAPKRSWPVDLLGRRSAVTVIKENSSRVLFWVDIAYTGGRPPSADQATSLRTARSIVRMHNNALALHRREQARNKATRLKLIKEKTNVRSS